MGKNRHVRGRKSINVLTKDQRRFQRWFILSPEPCKHKHCDNYWQGYLWKNLDNENDSWYIWSI